MNIRRKKRRRGRCSPRAATEEGPSAPGTPLTVGEGGRSDLAGEGARPDPSVPGPLADGEGARPDPFAPGPPLVADEGGQPDPSVLESSEKGDGRPLAAARRLRAEEQERVGR